MGHIRIIDSRRLKCEISLYTQTGSDNNRMTRLVLWSVILLGLPYALGQGGTDAGPSYIFEDASHHENRRHPLVLISVLLFSPKFDVVS